MRIDTNTRGHVQWFNFTVKNIGKKKVRFNIVNFKKNKSLYNRDLKPYIYSDYLKQAK
jgi:predicted lactoylglutathione lyase